MLQHIKYITIFILNDFPLLIFYNFIRFTIYNRA